MILQVFLHILAFDIEKTLCLENAMVKVLWLDQQKYAPELTNQLVGYISDGLTIRDACFGAGISKDTF